MFKGWIRNYLQYYAQKYCLSKPVLDKNGGVSVERYNIQHDKGYMYFKCMALYEPHNFHPETFLPVHQNLFDLNCLSQLFGTCLEWMMWLQLYHDL